MTSPCLKLIFLSAIEIPIASQRGIFADDDISFGGNVATNVARPHTRASIEKQSIAIHEEVPMNRQRTIAVAISAVAFASSSASAAPPGSADLVRARQLFFGIENVDATTGGVDNQKVVFSWITNASYAVSLKGRIVLLDTYVHRAETQPGRTPFVVQDLVSLQPEAIFLGHGHFDHADNAAFVAGNLGIPIYASEETCAAMQTDATNLFNAG